MNPNLGISAEPANNAYVNRSQSQVDNSTVYLDGQRHKIFGYKNDPVTGFHATAYQNLSTGDIVIAYRGTDPGHLVTKVQDIAVDATMARDRVNPQEAAASAFTQQMIDKVQRNGISKDRITVAGHSLGGTLAEIEAHKHGLGGATFNAYGAASLGYGVPEGGSKVTDYVMAGDVVSAASHHYGHVVTLASPDDLKSMQAGRYLDAPAGSQPPNPFLAMSLGDHSITHFTGPGSVLKPEMLAQYGKNYADNKAAIDAFRNDIHHDRSELSEALRQAQGHDAHAQLPPDIRRQLDEYLTVNVDPIVREKVEQNGVVLGAAHGLQAGADAVRAGSQHVQSQFEHVATAARTAGDAMAPVNPVAHLAGAVVGEAAHLQGKAAHAVGDLAANGLHAARQAIEHGAHDATRTIDAAIHSPAVQTGAVHLVNNFVGAYQAVENTGHAVERAYDHARQIVSHGVDAVEHGAEKAFDTLTHPEQWFGHGTTPASAAQPQHARANPIAESPYARDDPRHAANPHHALYQELHERIPSASEKRLLQFTAACHAGGISHANIGPIAYDEQHGIMHFMTASTLRPPVAVDVNTPSPDPQNSIHRIQQAPRLSFSTRIPHSRRHQKMLTSKSPSPKQMPICT